MEQPQTSKPLLSVCYFCGKLNFPNGNVGLADSAWVTPDSPEAVSIMGPMLKDDDSLRFNYTCCPDCLHYFERVTGQQRWREAGRASNTANTPEADLSSTS